MGSSVVCFNGGGEVNGSKPVEAIPYWLGHPPEPAPSAEPELPGPTDDELDLIAREAEVQNMKEQGGLGASNPEGIAVQLHQQRIAGLRAVWAHRRAILPSRSN